MVNRINLLLKAKNITARQFAEEIGIQPSGMSHIMSGRNNPSLDFVMKVIRRYPEIDINWLMFGKGEMYEAHPYNSSNSSVRSTPPTHTESPTAPVVPQPQVTKPSVSVQGDLFGQPAENRVNNERLNIGSENGNVVKSDNMPVASTEQAPPVMDSKTVVRTDAPIAPAPAQSPSPETAPVATPVSATAEVHQPSQSLSVGVAAAGSHPVVTDIPAEAPPERKLIRLLAFYDDHTFVEYRPQ